MRASRIPSPPASPPFLGNQLLRLYPFLDFGARRIKVRRRIVLGKGRPRQACEH
jgi:hypothetical protein